MLEFRTDSINVSINLIQSQHHKNTAYDVDVIPQVMVTINSTSAELQISYNTRYDIRITATLCGHTNATTLVTLTYSEHR